MKAYNHHIPGVPHGAQYRLRGLGHGGVRLGGRRVPGPRGRRAGGPGRGQAPLQRQGSDHAPAAQGLPALSGGDPVPGLCAGPPSVPLSAPAPPEPVPSSGPAAVALRRHWAGTLGATRASLYRLDTKPLPVVGYTRCKDRSAFAATADYGVCARRHLKDCGYKRVLLGTPAGVPAAYCYSCIVVRYDGGV